MAENNMTNNVDRLDKLYSEYVRLEIEVDKKPENAKQIFALYEELLQSKDNNSNALECAYGVLGRIMNAHPELEGKTRELIATGLKNEANDKDSRQIAYWVLRDFEKLKSSMSIGQRVPKSSDNEYGWEINTKIDCDKPCILILGGDGAQTEKSANGYAKHIRYLLKDYGFETKVNVYSLVYDFGYFHQGRVARAGLYEKYGRRNRKSPGNDRENEEENINPRYVKEIFEAVVLPRICTDDGKTRLDGNLAMEQARNLNIFAHSHGAYVALKLEEMMREKMNELGYSATETVNIQKQILVVAHAPCAPLGVSKFTFVSFGSATDQKADHQSAFCRYLKKNWLEDTKLCYFEGRMGNLFLAGKLDKYAGNEHNWSGFDDYSSNKLGKMLLHIEQNVLLNGVRSSLAKVALPDIEKLVINGSKKVSAKQLDKMTKNADKFRQKMVLSLRKNIRAGHG